MLASLDAASAMNKQQVELAPWLLMMPV